MDISSRVAQGLLSIGAVFLRPQEPPPIAGAISQQLPARLNWAGQGTGRK